MYQISKKMLLLLTCACLVFSQASFAGVIVCKAGYHSCTPGKIVGVPGKSGCCKNAKI